MEIGDYFILFKFNRSWNYYSVMAFIDPSIMVDDAFTINLITFNPFNLIKYTAFGCTSSFILFNPLKEC